MVIPHESLKFPIKELAVLKPLRKEAKSHASFVRDGDGAVAHIVKSEEVNSLDFLG